MREVPSAEDGEDGGTDGEKEVEPQWDVELPMEGLCGRKPTRAVCTDTSVLEESNQKRREARNGPDENVIPFRVRLCISERSRGVQHKID